MRPYLIILFAKSPEPGLVKTRLSPELTAENAAKLHIAFVEDMVRRFRVLEDTDFELHIDTRNDAWSDMGVTRKLQISGDLGLRMIHALDRALFNGYSKAIILGSDAPTLPVDHVRGLLSSRSDIALGPSEDGGFYAIAASRTDARMFDGVSWSQADTLASAAKAIVNCGLTLEMGQSWFDIDSPDDLRRLASQVDLPPSTAAFLQRFTRLPSDTS